MATSSAMNTSNEHIKYKITITQNSQSVANNTSNVTVSVNVYRTNTGYTTYGSGTIYCKINGTKYSASITSSDKITNSGIVLFSKTLNISHNSDGSKKLTCSAWIDHSQFSSSEQSYSQTLTTIPRKSTLSVANGTLNTEQKLTVTTLSSSFKHTITATCGSSSQTICSKSTSKSFSFTPPLTWASQNTTGTSVSVVYKITTYSGDTSIGTNTYTKTCSIPSSVKPSCTIAVSEATSYGAYVYGLSKLWVAVTPTLAYGSAIASYSTSVNGTTYTAASFTTGKLIKTGEITITTTVKDKRGRSATASKKITVVDKSTLTISNGTLGTAQTIKITEKSSTFKHKLIYKCGSTTGYILGGASSFSTALTTSWTPDKNLAKFNVFGTVVDVDFELETYTTNGALVGTSYYTKDFAIPNTEEFKPKCSISFSDATDISKKYGRYVKGKSKLAVTITPTLAYGSDIASYSVTANGVKYNTESFTTDLLTSSGELTISATVKDFRGRTGSAIGKLNVLDYAVPKIGKLTVGRCDKDGTKNNEGAFVKVTFSGSVTSLNDKNSAKYTIKYKKSTASSYTSVSLSDYQNQYSISNKTYVFAAETGSSYDVQFVIADDFKTITQKTSASTAFTLMHFSAGGTGVGIGKVSEAENTFDVGIDGRFRKNVTFGEKSGYHDGKTGVYVSNEGFIHIQRDTSKGNRPYLGFYLNNATDADGQIRVTADTGYMEFLSADGYKFDNHLYLPNSIGICGADADGTFKNAFTAQSTDGNTTIGHGNYAAKSGNTNIYGHDVNFAISNLAASSTFRPYRRQGDTINIVFRGAGYVTNSSKDVSFWIPCSIPIVGSPTATALSTDGFVLRQGSEYTHGSSAETFVNPSNYEAIATYGSGIYIKAEFTNTTNATNNDTIGIYWSGKITFS